MATTLKNLALALLNATLILVALCLFLAWKISQTVDGVAQNFASSLQIVTPLREDVGAMTSELAALRADLATIRDQTGEARSQAMGAVQDRMSAIDARLSDASARLAALQDAPRELLDQSVERTMAAAADEFSRAVNDIRGCTAPAS